MLQEAHAELLRDLYIDILASVVISGCYPRVALVSTEACSMSCRVFLLAGPLNMNDKAAPSSVENHSRHGHHVHAGPGVFALPECR